MSFRSVLAAAALFSLTACGTDGPVNSGSVPIVPATSYVTSVVVSPLTTLLTVGDSLRLTASPRDTSGSVLAGRVVSWSSESPAIATVSSNGLVKAISAGSVRITALSEGRTGTATITTTR